MESKKIDLSLGKKTIKVFAMQRVSTLVKELIGERSIRRTAEDSNVAASYITGIVNQKYLPSAEILRKLTAPSAKPQNGVTMEDLMIAAGYQTDYIEVAVEEPGILDANDNTNGNDSVTHDWVREHHRERMQEIRKFESMVTGIIYKTLAEKGLSFSYVNEVMGVRGYKPDVAVYVSQQPVLEWWFEIKFLGNITGRHGNRGYVNLRHILGQFMFVEPKLERKVSLVIDNEEDFELIVSYKDKLAYRGDLSVILVDTETYSVVREEYLAHYNLNEQSAEFYLV